MKKCDNSTRKIHINSNFVLSISLLIMFNTLLLRPSVHCNTPLHFTTFHSTTLHYTSLHFTTLHPTTLHYTYRHFTSYHLHFTTISFSFTHLYFLSFRSKTSRIPWSQSNTLYSPWTQNKIARIPRHQNKTSHNLWYHKWKFMHPLGYRIKSHLFLFRGDSFYLKPRDNNYLNSRVHE